MNINVFYRHYCAKDNNNKARPRWFSYRTCLENFIYTMKDTSNITVHLMYDDTIGPFDYSIIKAYQNDDIDIRLVSFRAGSDWDSFKYTCDYAHNLLSLDNYKKDTLLYFLENDYLHVYGWDEKVLELYKTYSNLDYVSLYDHSDKYYDENYHGLMSYLFCTKSHHWRSTPSTCASFIMDSKKFIEDYDILSTVPGDHNKFLLLAKERNRSVITPIPGLSTHCMSQFLSPTINWEQINNDYM